MLRKRSGTRRTRQKRSIGGERLDSQAERPSGASVHVPLPGNSGGTR